MVSFSTPRPKAQRRKNEKKKELVHALGFQPLCRGEDAPVAAALHLNETGRREKRSALIDKIAPESVKKNRKNIPLRILPRRRANVLPHGSKRGGGTRPSFLEGSNK